MSQASSQPLPVQLAKASWIAPLLILGVNFFLRQGGQDPSKAAAQSGVFAVVAFVLSTAGLVAGIATLAGLRKYGRKGILTPAVIGCLLSGIYFTIFVTNLLRGTGAR